MRKHDVCVFTWSFTPTRRDLRQPPTTAWSSTAR